MWATSLLQYLTRRQPPTGHCRLAPGLSIDPPEARSAPDEHPTWLNHDVAEVGVWCSGVGGPTTIGPIILSPLQKSFSLCPYGVYL
ncbi:hypothetical protein GW17_00060074 [Ensete ventricosum]|nr:hypothetical protein GW17_00060074 [Ensete ventricosum]